MNLKIVIAALVLIVLLFVAGLTLGACSGEGGPEDGAGWVKSLFGGFTDRRLEPGDVTTATASCLQGQDFVVPAGGTCTYQLKDSVFLDRTLHLGVRAGQPTVTVVVSQLDLVTARETIAPGRPKSFFIQRKRERIVGAAPSPFSVQCIAPGPNPPPCRFTLDQ